MKLKKVLRLALALGVLASSTLVGGAPASAVTKIQVNIWSYGNVIEPWGETEYDSTLLPQS